MTRHSFHRSALIAAGLLANLGAPSLAQAPAAFFTAQLSAPAPEARFAAGGVVWHCEGTACRAARSTARPLRVCSSLRREAGVLVSFAAGGEALADDQLARCNG